MEVMASTQVATEGRLRATDNSLPFLAAQAAVELKLFSVGKRSDLPSLSKLSHLISNSLDLQEQMPPRSLMDPSTVSVMSQALEDSLWTPQKLKTIGEMAGLALNVADEMKKQCGTTETNGNVKRMMDFCTALARYSSAYRKTVLGQSRKHPYRK